MDRLQAAGVGVRLNMASTGRISGISFDMDGHIFKGSKIGKSYTWGNLQKRVEYVQDRDREAVSARQNKTSPQQSANHNRSASAGAGKCNTDSTRFGGAAIPNATDTLEGAKSGSGAGEKRGKNAIPNASNPGCDGQGAKNKNNTIVNTLRDATKWSVAAFSVSSCVSKTFKPNNRDIQSNTLTFSTSIKIKKWRKQHAALGAPAYRLTLVSRRNNLKTFNLGKNKSKEGEKFYSAIEVEKLIPYLAAQNLRGYDIYITPINPDFHYIVLDDSTTEKILKAKKRYGRPCIVQESSKGNFQAIFKVPKKEFSREQQIANKLVQKINREFGDPKFSGVIHPFRMAGFSNKKEKKKNFFVRLVEAGAVVAEQLREQLEQLREQEAARQVARQKEQTLKELDEKIFGDDIWSKEKRKQIGLAKRLVEQGIWSEVDYSVVDFRVVMALLKRRYSVNQIAAWFKRDPSVAQRHAHAVEDYVERTISAAVSVLEERQAERSRSSKGMGM